MMVAPDEMDASEESPRAPAQCRYCGELHPASFSHCPKTGQPLNTGRALVGRVIAGRYRVLGLLGEGGMGAVYVAEHLMIGRKVALKRLHPELMGDEKAVKRFQREARAAASIGHEHIVEVLDLGFGEDGAPFLVMEYLRGKSLAQIIREEGRLEPRRACHVVGQVLAALGAVHRRGIVHRDLKPDNVIVGLRRGVRDFVKVVDFGISKMREEDGEPGLSLTRTGVMLGTPFYMSPEQARGVKDLDHRVDLYGAGLILYESLTGRLPFEGSNYHQLLGAILSGKHPRARELSPAVPEALDAIIEKSLALDPEQRYPSARELLLALVPHGAIDPGPLESVPPPPGNVALGDAKTTPMLRPSADRAPSPSPEAPIASDASPPPARPAAPPPRRVAPKGLAAEVRAVTGQPRRFVAQSPDWADESSPGKALPSALREEPVHYASRRPEEPPPARAPAAATRVKGSLLLATLDRLRATDVLDRVLERVSGGVATELARVILPMAWFPLPVYLELLRAAERELGGTEGTLIVRLGRATADRELTTTHRLSLQNATPAMAVERIPQVFRSYHAPGHVSVELLGAGTCRVEAHGIEPDTFTHALLMSGFYPRMLELAGAQDVRAAITSCRERGEPATATSLRWR